VTSRTSFLFLYAGAAAVGFAVEVLWLKRLALVFGASLPAVGTGLSVFTAAYASGAAGAGRWARPGRDPRRAIAVLQALTGAWCIAMPWLVGVVEPAHDLLAAGRGPVLVAVVRVVGAVVLLGPPAAALGALYPLVAGAGARRAYVYGMAGAVAGALAATAVPNAALGFRAAFFLLGAVSLAVGALTVRVREAPAIVASPAGGSGGTGRAARVALLLGLGLFAAQAVWFRLIWLVVDQTVYTEGVLVAVVLLCMTGGGLLARRWRVSARPALVFLGVAQLVPAIAMGDFAAVWSRHAPEGSLALFLLLQAVFVAALVGGPCIAYGFLLPVLCHGRSNRAVARIWSRHHVGCCAGGLAASFLLVPRIGVTATLAIATACVALALFAERARLLGAAITGLCAIAAFAGDATYRARAAGAAKLLFHHEDGAGITEVVEDPADGSRQLLSSRRRQEGGSKPDQVVLERLQGRLPLALQSRHERLLVVGLGTGITLGASVPETVREAVCVEISPGVIEAARYFRNENRDVLNDPRVTILCEDGRAYVRLARRTFDLIVQELFFPYRSGVGGLYTSEHYERCRALLAPGGRVAQWISLAQITPENLRSLARTFTDVFPETSVWLVGGYLLLLGGQEPVVPAADVLRHFVATGAAVRDWARGAVENTEDNMHIQASVPRAFRMLNSTELTLRNLRALLAIQQDADALDPDLPTAATRAARLLHRGILRRAEQGDEAAQPLYEEAYRLDPGNLLVRRFLAERHAAEGDYAAAVQLDATFLAARYNLGVRLYRQRRYTRAADQFRAVLAAQRRAPDALFNLANCLARLGRHEEAAQRYRAVLRLRPRHADAFANLIEVERALRRKRRTHN